jgi:hypothetical protein
MKLKKQIRDPRGVLVCKLTEAGIDAQNAHFIAVDAGLSLVDKEYLIDLGLRGKQLKDAENLVKDFYWDEDAFD